MIASLLIILYTLLQICNQRTNSALAGQYGNCLTNLRAEVLGDADMAKGLYISTCSSFSAFFNLASFFPNFAKQNRLTDTLSSFYIQKDSNLFDSKNDRNNQECDNGWSTLPRQDPPFPSEHETDNQTRPVATSVLRSLKPSSTLANSTSRSLVVQNPPIHMLLASRL
jgi:hypothetical protein